MRPAQLPTWMPVFLLLLSLPAQAAEWLIEPTTSLRSGYNDNIRLDTGPHDSVWETAITPSVRFGVAKEDRGLFGKAYASVRRFSGGSGRNSSSVLDREDYHFDTDAYYGTERNQFSGLVNYTQDSTLDSELDQTGQVLSSRATRERITLGPRWIHTLNESTQLDLSYNYTTVTYSDKEDFQRLIEYDYHQFSAALVRQLTPRIQGTLSTAYSSYQPDSGFDSDTTNIQVGLSRSFSETLSTSWLAGYRETTSDTLIATGFCVGADPGAGFPGCKGGAPVQTGTAKDDDTNTGSVYSVNITKLLEKGNLSASLSRSSNPSSDGELLDTTRLTLTGNHQFTEKLRTSLSIEYYNNEDITRVSNNIRKTDEDTYRVRPKLFWKWHRDWQLAAEYEYVENENKDRNSGTARRNAFYLTLSYQHPKISISR
jgi:hypothetical protein